MDVDDARVARRDAILRVFTPEVSAGTYAYSNFGRSVDPETNTYVSTTSFNNGYQLGAGITLFDGFSAVNNMKISKTALKMGIGQEELTRDEICLATMEAFYNVVYFQQLSGILESQVRTAQDALTLAKKQEELGQKGYTDVIEMEAELADRRAALQEEAYLLNLRKLEQGLISTIDFQKASDNCLNAKTSRLDALLKFYIKRSVVNYYNGIS